MNCVEIVRIESSLFRKDAAMVYATSTGRQISDQTAFELHGLYHEARSERLAARLWREVLSEEDRASLGGDFAAAYRNEHLGVGMLQRLHPELTFERALLEFLRSVGWLAEARYERLVEGIGESRVLPASEPERPQWNAKQGQLAWQNQ